MQAIYYYPTKLSITQGGEEDDDLEDLFDKRWKGKARRLQARRWRKVHEMEHNEEEEEHSRQEKSRQKHWLQRHGWPRVAQPIV